MKTLIDHGSIVMAKIVWACTHIVKEAEVYHFTEGCKGKRAYIMDEGCMITASSLPELINEIGDAYYLDVDDVFIPGDDEVIYIGFNRLENNEGDEPTEPQRKLWERGEKTLFLADYLFWIEKSLVEELMVTRKDFEEAAIRHH